MAVDARACVVWCPFARCSRRPEGLGINRGFLGAFDCADLVLRATPLLITPLGQPPSTPDDFTPILQRREAIFALTKRISGNNRQKEMKHHLDANRKLAYTIDPGSRYISWTEAGGGRDAAALNKPVGGPPRMAFHVK